jgi:hypothetical protein
MSEYTITMESNDIHFVIGYNYEYDSGCWRDSNGDGTPPSCEMDIMSVYVGEDDILEFLYQYAPKFLKAIEDYIIENHNG